MAKNIDWERLVLQAQTGDDEAYNELWLVAEPLARNFCRKTLKSETDVDDALQNIAEVLWRSLTGRGRAPIKDPKRFPAWLKTTCHNECLTFLDKKQRRTSLDDYRPQMGDEEYAGMDEIAADDLTLDYSPERAVENDELAAFLLTFINDLPESQKQCFLLHETGETYDIIADKLGMPSGTVKSNVFYAKKAMRKAIHKAESEYNISIHGYAFHPQTGGWISYDKQLPDNGDNIPTPFGEKVRGVMQSRWFQASVVTIIIIVTIIVSLLRFTPQKKNPENKPANIQSPPQVTVQHNAPQDDVHLDEERTEKQNQEVAGDEGKNSSEGRILSPKKSSSSSMSTPLKISPNDKKMASYEVIQGDTTESRTRYSFVMLAGSMMKMRMANLERAALRYNRVRPAEQQLKPSQLTFRHAFADLNDDGKEEAYVFLELRDGDAYTIELYDGVNYDGHMMDIPSELSDSSQSLNNRRMAFPKKHELGVLNGVSPKGVSEENLKDYSYSSYKFDSSNKALVLYEKIYSEADGKIYQKKDGNIKELSKKKAMKEFKRYYEIFYGVNGKKSKIKMPADYTVDAYINGNPAIAWAMDFPVIASEADAVRVMNAYPVNIAE